MRTPFAEPEKETPDRLRWGPRADNDAAAADPDKDSPDEATKIEKIRAEIIRAKIMSTGLQLVGSLAPSRDP